MVAGGKISKKFLFVVHDVKGEIMMYVLKLKNLVTMLLFVFVLCFSCLCSAGITFQADGGKNFLLDFNNKNSFGRYVLLDANGSVVFTFDFNGNTQEFTTYKPDGSLLAIRKMLSWDRMLHKEKPNYDYIVCVRRSDGDYYRENHSSPSFYEHTPKAFNTFLANKSLFMVGQPSAKPETKQGSVTYKAKNGTYTLTYNNVDNYGRYVVFVNKNVVDITFDFDPVSKEFTVYRVLNVNSGDGSVWGIVKMLSPGKMLFKKTRDAQGYIFNKHSFYRDYIREDGNRLISESTGAAFNIILKRNGDLG